MKKPELTITKYDTIVPVEGSCTSCPDVKFTVPNAERMGPPEAQNVLNGQFKKHFKEVHMHEDASQAAARIVREATET
jgi:hypothetical protein